MIGACVCGCGGPSIHFVLGVIGFGCWFGISESQALGYAAHRMCWPGISESQALAQPDRIQRIVIVSWLGLESQVPEGRCRDRSGFGNPEPTVYNLGRRQRMLGLDFRIQAVRDSEIPNQHCHCDRPVPSSSESARNVSRDGGPGTRQKGPTTYAAKPFVNPRDRVTCRRGTRTRGAS